MTKPDETATPCSGGGNQRSVTIIRELGSLCSDLVRVRDVLGEHEKAGRSPLAKEVTGRHAARRTTYPDQDNSRHLAIEPTAPKPASISAYVLGSGTAKAYE